MLYAPPWGWGAEVSVPLHSEPDVASRYSSNIAPCKVQFSNQPIDDKVISDCVQDLTIQIRAQLVHNMKLHRAILSTTATHSSIRSSEYRRTPRLCTIMINKWILRLLEPTITPTYQGSSKACCFPFRPPTASIHQGSLGWTYKAENHLDTDENSSHDIQ